MVVSKLRGNGELPNNLMNEVNDSIEEGDTVDVQKVTGLQEGI